MKRGLLKQKLERKAPSTVGLLDELLIYNSTLVTKGGNDATAIRNDWSKPFLTFTAAKAAAQDGDTICVFSGTYDEKNIGRSNITINAIGRVIVEYTGSDDGALIDDTATGTNAKIENMRVIGDIQLIRSGTGNEISLKGCVYLLNGSDLLLDGVRIKGDGYATPVLAGTNFLSTGATITIRNAIIENTGDPATTNGTVTAGYGGTITCYNCNISKASGAPVYTNNNASAKIYLYQCNVTANDSAVAILYSNRGLIEAHDCYLLNNESNGIGIYLETSDSKILLRSSTTYVPNESTFSIGIYTESSTTLILDSATVLASASGYCIFTGGAVDIYLYSLYRNKAHNEGAGAVTDIVGGLDILSVNVIP